MDRETEVQLVGRLRAGDPAAFDAVHAAFNARVYNFLARLSNRRDVAEDLLEETWLRLVVYAPRLRPDTRLGPWLFTVARNLHTSHCRSRLLEDSHAAGLLGLWPCGSPGPSPFEEAEASGAARVSRIAAGASIAGRSPSNLRGVCSRPYSSAASAFSMSSRCWRLRCGCAVGFPGSL